MQNSENLALAVNILLKQIITENWKTFQLNSCTLIWSARASVFVHVFYCSCEEEEEEENYSY